MKTVFAHVSLFNGTTHFWACTLYIFKSLLSQIMHLVQLTIKITHPTPKYGRQSVEKWVQSGVDRQDKDSSPGVDLAGNHVI